jgi:hypothetical protein
MRFSVMRPGFALSLLTVLAVVPVAARAPQAQATAAQANASAASNASLPSAREVIDRHVKEVGGRQAILAQSSMHTTGTVSLPAAGISGKMEAFHAKPNRFLQRMTLPGIGDLEEGYNGTVGWSLSPLTGPALLEGKQLEQRIFDADFYDELKLPARYTSMTTVEKTTFEGRSVYKLRLVQKSGEEDIEFYDVETGLKAGAITTRDSPMGPVQGTMIISDYKKFGALMQPTLTKVSLMGTQMIMTVSAIEYGAVDTSIFTPPAQIKALVK